jgi:hypothetical protein
LSRSTRANQTTQPDNPAQSSILTRSTFAVVSRPCGIETGWTRVGICGTARTWLPGLANDCEERETRVEHAANHSQKAAEPA